MSDPSSVPPITAVAPPRLDRLAFLLAAVALLVVKVGLLSDVPW